MNPDSNFFAHINLSFKPNHITRGFCFFLYYQHILRTEVLMSSDSCTTHTPLVTKSHGTGCAGNPFYTSSRRATGEHLLQSLLPLCLCPQPQGQGQPSYCYGKHTGDWINFLAIRVWKLRQCQEEAVKSWICQTNPFTPNSWRSPVRLLDLPSFEKMWVSTYACPVQGGWPCSDHWAQRQPSPASPVRHRHLGKEKLASRNFCRITEPRDLCWELEITFKLVCKNKKNE